MTAFDQAWEVAKMPLVRDSIKVRLPDSTGFPTANAIFQDPDNPDNEYPIRAYEDQGGTRMVLGSNDDVMGQAYFNTGHQRYGEAMDDTTTGQINTFSGNERKGVATAMYDLINEMGKMKGVRLKTRAGNLSSYSAPLWAKVLGLPYEGNDQISAHTKFQRDNREPLYWPEKGVYE